MPKLLCKAFDVFSIDGQGTVIVLEPSCKWRIPQDEVLKQYEVIRILRPDQTSLKTFIKGFEFIRKSGVADGLCIMLPKDIGKADVPGDSLIFLERDGSEPVIWEGMPPNSMQ